MAGPRFSYRPCQAEINDKIEEMPRCWTQFWSIAVVVFKNSNKIITVVIASHVLLHVSMMDDSLGNQHKINFLVGNLMTLQWKHCDYLILKLNIHLFSHKSKHKMIQKTLFYWESLSVGSSSAGTLSLRRNGQQFWISDAASKRASGMTEDEQSPGTEINFREK